MKRWQIGLIVGAALFGALCTVGAVATGLYLLLRPGQSSASLLLVGSDSHLRLLQGESTLRDLASDSSTDVFRYPVPSPDGRSLAYVGVDQKGSALMVLDLASGQRREVYRSLNSPPMYVNWSPDARYLSFLVNSKGGGLHTHVVPADGSKASELISPIAPAYFVWSPDSSTLLLHLGGSGYEGGKVATYRPGGVAQPILNDPGLLFRTPAWSRDGSRLFYVAQAPVQGEMTEEKVESVITRAAPDGSQPEALVREPRALLFFMRAPTSDSLAYLKMTSRERSLNIWDEASKASRKLSRDDEVVTEFFWAPDGASIAYLTLERTPATAEVRNRRWHLVDLASSKVRDFEQFAPSQAFEGMLSFFDAYAISFDLWSPDGGQIVYGAEDGVYTLDPKSGKKTRVGDGVLGMWLRG